MICLILDILIYNYTSFKSYFFLTNINSKSLIYNIAIALFIDLFITHAMLLNTIYVICMYLLHKYLKINYYNVINYYLFNISIIYIYYIIVSTIYNSGIIYFNVFIINSIFILISYIKDSKDIKLYR